MRKLHWIGMALFCIVTGCNGVDAGESKAPSALEGDGTKDAGDPDPGGTTDPDVCSDDGVTGAVGNGSCVATVDLKNAASDTLCPEGLYLASFDIDFGDCPDEQALSASYSCCPNPPPSDQPDKPPPGDDPGDSCSVESIAFDACVDEADVQAAVGAACAVDSTLVDLKVDEEGCPEGQASEAWFTCCPVSD